MTAASIKQRWETFWPSALTVTLAASIPFGLFMAWYMDNPEWLWFCAPIFIFLS